jgi:hypothetical protein
VEPTAATLDIVVSCGDSNNDVAKDDGTEGDRNVRELGEGVVNGRGVEAISALLDVMAEEGSCKTEEVSSRDDAMEISTPLLDDSATLTGMDVNSSSEV